MNQLKLGNKIIGKEQPLYFIADIGANHDGDIQRAYKLIELAKESGADAAKFQNFKADKIVSNYGFQHLDGQLSHQASWEKSVYEVYQDASIDDDWTPLLKNKCDEVGIDYFTSAYDFESVDHANNFVDVFKIGSGDISWSEILAYTAKKGKPILLATGASNLEDVKRAMDILLNYTDDIVLMQCNTNYTTDPEKFKYINLKVLKTFSALFPNIMLGLSDHTPGHATVLGAVALGARVIEKHFTDDNNRIGPDHSFAMNPKSWSEMVNNAYALWHALGDGVKRVEQNEVQPAIVQRRSLRVKNNLPKGHVIQKDDLFPLRPIPDGAIPPYEIDKIIGKTLLKNLTKGEHLTYKILS